MENICTQLELKLLTDLRMSSSSFSSHACIMDLLGIANQADKIEAALPPLFLVFSNLCPKQVLSAR